LGLKIRAYIDKIKESTSHKNRPKNRSADIYEVLKIITLPATSLTNLTKYRDMKSIIITKLIVVDLSEIASHSIMISSNLRSMLAE